jgi:hypothetical protein
VEAAALSARPSLDALRVADPPAAWADLGFAVEGAELRLGTTRLLFDPAPGARGITGWRLRDVPAGDIDGLPTEVADGDAAGPSPAHPNGAIGLDHVVVMTPDLERTLGALHGAGFELRRLRDATERGRAIRQAFFRMGEVILEVVGPAEAEVEAGAAPAAFWGLVVVVDDLDACADRLGDRLGGVHDAVQSGRRIATLRTDAGVSVPVALMTPAPPKEPGSAR